MMEEKQLQHYRFFTWVGAFSVDLTHGSKAVASLRYAQKLLEKPEAAIWIFPQGKLCRADEPIAFKPGTDYLARKTPGAMLVPLALRYDFFREDRPNVLIEVGRPFAASELTEGRLERECNEAFSRVSEAAQKQDLSGFSRVFAPRWTVNKRWEWVKRAMTGRLEGFKAEN